MSTQAVPATPAFADPSVPAKKDPSAPAKKKGFKNKKFFLPVVAVIVGATLVGAALEVRQTDATWQASITQGGETIDSGTLGLAKPGAATYFDTSSDKAAPTAIDLSTFRAVPGDQISISQAQAVTMIGTNLKADWSVSIPSNGALTGALAAPGSGVTAKVYFGVGPYDPTTFKPANALASASLDGTDSTPIVHFNQPALNGNVSYLNDGSLTDGATKLFSVVVIDFASTATDNTIQGTQADLSALNYTLLQVR
ncbi:hypothetical protein AB0284_20195 [Pseudarthrobacter phenanthrenivorans]|uniref:hypothetical protein n=1 Tax=Pseudarthrobacter phenanthrenivorans TaxID=361575 RepID=UPI00344F8385